MELQTYKSNYGHSNVDCPFCSKPLYAEKGDVKRLQWHISVKAKQEAFAKAVDGLVETPHLDYYIAHTDKKTVAIAVKRQYDSDLKIT